MREETAHELSYRIGQLKRRASRERGCLVLTGMQICAAGVEPKYLRELGWQFSPTSDVMFREPPK